MRERLARTAPVRPNGLHKRASPTSACLARPLPMIDPIHRYFPPGTKTFQFQRPAIWLTSTWAIGGSKSPASLMACLSPRKTIYQLFAAQSAMSKFTGCLWRPRKMCIVGWSCRAFMTWGSPGNICMLIATPRARRLKATARMAHQRFLPPMHTGEVGAGLQPVPDRLQRQHRRRCEHAGVRRVGLRRAGADRCGRQRAGRAV